MDSVVEIRVVRMSEAASEDTNRKDLQTGLTVSDLRRLWQDF